MTRKQRHLLIAAAATLVVAVGIGFFVRTQLVRPDLRTALAKTFNVPRERIALNVPPRDGRYPGAVIVSVQPGFDFPVLMVSRPDNAGAESFEIEGALLEAGGSSLLFGGDSLGLSARGSADATVTVTLRELRVLERPLAQLREELLKDESVRRARANGQKLQVVSRAYEAVPTFVVSSKRGLSADQASKLGAELSSTGQASSEQKLTLAASSARVVAFETLDVDFVTGQFGGPGAVDVKLAPHFEGDGPLESGALERLGVAPAAEALTFVTIASRDYRVLGNLPAAVHGAAEVAHVLETAGARRSEVSPPLGRQLDDAGLERALASLENAVRSGGAKIALLYFAGHAESLASGDQILILGSYKGTLAEDLRRMDPLHASEGELELVGGNVGDLLAAARAGAEPAGVPGLVPVKRVHERLERLSVPFAILVDGCYDNADLAHVRQTLKFTPFGDYYGMSDFPARELSEYHARLQRFGLAPHLRSENPIILGARPGSIGLETPHPVFPDFRHPLPPLAAKAVRVFSNALGEGGGLPLGQFLRSLADNAGTTGQMSMRGSITWSDFSKMNGLPLLKPTR